MDRKAEWGEGVFAFLDERLEGDVHAKGVRSLANATLGAMMSASSAAAVIGRSSARARGLLTRHAIEQVDRPLSDRAIDPWEIAARWVPEVIGSSTDILVVMDWTDFAADGPTTLALDKVTPHGRAPRGRGLDRQGRPGRQADRRERDGGGAPRRRLGDAQKRGPLRHLACRTMSSPRPAGQHRIMPVVAHAPGRRR